MSLLDFLTHPVIIFWSLFWLTAIGGCEWLQKKEEQETKAACSKPSTRFTPMKGNRRCN